MKEIVKEVKRIDDEIKELKKKIDNYKFDSTVKKHFELELRLIKKYKLGLQRGFNLAKEEFTQK